MSRVTSWLDDCCYPNHGSNWDDVIFREAILGRLRSEDHVLDLGAGAGIVPQMNFRGLVRHVAGVDPDPRVAANPYLDEAKVGLAEAIPFRVHL